jgi:hypothetical protein
MNQMMTYSYKLNIIVHCIIVKYQCNTIMASWHNKLQVGTCYSTVSQYLIQYPVQNREIERSRVQCHNVNVIELQATDYYKTYDLVLLYCTMLL